MSKNFTTTITVDAPAQEVYNIINNVSGWWHGEVKGNTTQVNDEFEYRFQHFHYSKQRIVELVPNEKIVWLVTESKLSFTKDPSEWTGTKIVFELTTVDNKTQIHFTHEGLVPTFECYGDCSNGWSMLIQQSLHSLITKGKGVEVF